MKSKSTLKNLLIFVVAILLLAACQPATPEATAVPTAAPTAVPTAVPTEVPTPVPTAAPPPASTEPLMANLPALAKNSIYVYVEDAAAGAMGNPVVREVRNWAAVGAVTTGSTDGIAAATVTNMGANSWEPKFFVEMPQMTSGTEYTVRFVAYAETARPIWVKVGQQLTNDPWWLPQFESEEGVIYLTPQPTEYSFTFTYEETGNPTVYDLIWEVGNVMGEGQLTTVYVTNVLVSGNACCMADPAPVPTEEVVVETPVVAETSINVNVVDAAGEVTRDPIVRDVRKWADIGNVNVAITEGVVEAEVLEMGGNSWEPKFFVEMPTLVSGTEYKVSFVAHADVPRKIVVKVGQQLANDPWWIPQFEGEEGVFSLTTEPTEYSFMFTFQGNDNAALYDLIWEVGNYMGEGQLTTVYVENVTVTGQGCCFANAINISLGDDAANPVLTEVRKWADIGNVNVTVTGGVVKAEVLDMGANSWEPKFFVEMPPMVSGTEYTVSFVAHADVARTIVVKVGQQLTNDPWWIPQFEGEEGVISLTTEPTEYSFKFTYQESGNPALYDLIWEVGNYMGEGQLTNVYVTNVTVK